LAGDLLSIEGRWKDACVIYDRAAADASVAASTAAAWISVRRAKCEILSGRRYDARTRIERLLASDPVEPVRFVADDLLRRLGPAAADGTS
ncbi:MAG: hypothetical protein JSV80_05620, partial [Acidobacteriota bacterium]